MSEMSERVAKAIYHATPRNKPYDRLAPVDTRHWEKRAQAALQALLGPTEHMLTVGACYEDQDRQLVSEGEEARDIWNNMVLAALK
ncbi:hypothetical protein [Mesorhizobium ciceri]|uniref:hypothetical protein n=1 Tax=Mesorhizobium TaxID=68287 RepID=UPI0004ACFD60|nr:hypothetical protein [Mesorhizobium ciceri]